MSTGLGVFMVAASAAATAAPGDWLVRVGPVSVSPNDESGELSGIAGGEVSVAGDTSLGITIGYMLSDKLGIGVLGALPFKHEISGEGSIAGLGAIADVEHLPPTVTLQYHFSPEAGVRPYVGAGLNYTTFFSEETKGALDGTDISLDASFGLAVEAGVDVDINQDWFLSAQFWYIDIATTAELSGGIGKVDVDINPWVFMLGAGRSF
ncbi:MAG: OmpW family protein [Gammaproteobacteria bacterium]